MQYTIAAIVPFLNEENYLNESVKRLLDTNLFDQIVLVNDGSVDKSVDIAKDLDNKNDIIELINLDTQQGKGNAIKTALKKIVTSHTIVHDADLEYFPSDIPEMFEIAKKNQGCLVLGSRTIKGIERIKRYKITYFGNKLLTYFFSFMNFYKVSDIASCYWLIETEMLKKIDIKEPGFAIEVEVLSKYLKLDSNILEIPIHYEGRLYSDGKKIKFVDGISIFFKIIQYSKINIFF